MFFACTASNLPTYHEYQGNFVYVYETGPDPWFKRYSVVLAFSSYFYDDVTKPVVHKMTWIHLLYPSVQSKLFLPCFCLCSLLLSQLRWHWRHQFFLLFSDLRKYTWHNACSMMGSYLFWTLRSNSNKFIPFGISYAHTSCVPFSFFPFCMFMCGNNMGQTKKNIQSTKHFEKGCTLEEKLEEMVLFSLNVLYDTNISCSSSLLWE